MATQLIHETNVFQQHRIIVIRDGTPKCGEWFEYHQVATLNKYRAVTQGSNIFPQGIFTITPVTYEPIGG